MIFKYVISYSHNPYFNLAYELALFDYVTSDDLVIVFLWQNDNTIVIGRNQDITKELRYEEFVNNNGNVARRLSGGGAVYHDLGNLCFSFIFKNINNFDYKPIIIEALNKLGINSTFNGRNDIVIDNKKISGNATYDNGDIICQHGTILVNSNKNMMKKYLTPEMSKLVRNGVQSVESRTINLKEINPQISMKELIKKIIEVTDATKLKEKVCKTKILDLQKCFSSQKWIIEGKFDENSLFIRTRA